MTACSSICCKTIFKTSGGIHELSGRPSGLGLQWPFRGIDALVAYCMVRHFQPRLIIEVGSGFSSLVLGQAAAQKQELGSHLYRTISAASFFER